MLLSRAICYKMSISRLNCLEMLILVPIERLLADFRWQRIDFVDALRRALKKNFRHPDFLFC